MPERPIELTEEHRRLAAEIVLDHARDIERSTVREALRDQGAAQNGDLVTAIHRAAVTAVITVDIDGPEPEGGDTSEEMTHQDVAEQIGRYFRAVHGPDYVYRAPETYPNVLERWMIAVALGNVEFAAELMGQIEAAMAGERR